MGANLLIVVVTVTLQSSQPDSTASSLSAAPHAVEPSRTRDSILPDNASPSHGFGYERHSDAFQYNRVQGLSLGVGYHVSVPGFRFTELYGTVRYGISDERVGGRLTVRRDAPGNRVTLSGYVDIADLDPFSPGRTFSNTFNGLFAGHDNGDYALVGGGSALFESALGDGPNLAVSVKIEQQSSVNRVARSAVNDWLGGTGLFPPNPPIDEGTFGGASVRLSGVGDIRWNLTADALGGAGHTTARLFGGLRWEIGSRRGITLQLKAGAATAPALPQSLFRLGGVNTVRGFEYGTSRGPAIWVARADLAPIGGRVRPVLFMDAGQASTISELFSSQALVGGGIGVSLLRGLIRFDLSHPITPDPGGKLRFDLVIGGVR
jgi:hemolysin secretion/activation protein ShlB/FhaC/HecB